MSSGDAGQEGNDVCQGLGFGVRKWGEWGAWARMLESMGDIAQTRYDGVGTGTGRHSYFGGEPRDGIADAKGASFFNPQRVAAIGFHCWAAVESVEAVSGP